VSQHIVERSRAAALNEAANIGIHNLDSHGSDVVRSKVARLELIRYCEWKSILSCPPVPQHKYWFICHDLFSFATLLLLHDHHRHPHGQC
jgi:hypothetical protein